MSELIPKNKIRDGYSSTELLDENRATLSEVSKKLNEVTQKLEELVAFFIGE